MINNGLNKPNSATIDHKYPRHHWLRLTKPLNGERRRYLVCYDCNQKKRSVDDMIILKYNNENNRNTRWDTMFR